MGIVGVASAATIMAADLSGRRARRLDLLGLVTMATGVVTKPMAREPGESRGLEFTLYPVVVCHRWRLFIYVGDLRN